jgi:hypothetical protein
MRNELSLDELDREEAAELPARELMAKVKLKVLSLAKLKIKL